MKAAVLSGVLLIAMGSVYSEEQAPEPIRMNQIQVIGTHNSYHVRPDAQLLSLLRAIVPESEGWDYTHAPLDVQLERGVRSFELDLFLYPDGIQVFHVPHYDQGSTCPLFVECLQTVRAWSKANPGHVPITFLMEIKEELVALSTTPLLDLNESALLGIDAEIRSVFSPDELFSPDDLRGEAATLEEAVTQQGWPPLDEVRNKVMFILHEARELRDIYTKNAPTLEGRAMFIRSSPGRPDAAVIVADHPDLRTIPDLVQRGYFVRTRADSGLRPGRRGQLERRQRAFDSGAHIVTTDFPPGQMDAETGYVVQFHDGVAARCNPVNAPEGCRAPLEPIKVKVPEKDAAE